VCVGAWWAFAREHVGAARAGRTAESLRSEDLELHRAGGWGEGWRDHIIGPKAGYSPQVGTLVSMLTVDATGDWAVDGGDDAGGTGLFVDAKANTIGALMLHLAATEVFYQANTFEGKELSEEMKRKWGPAMDLGDAGRKRSRGTIAITIWGF